MHPDWPTQSMTIREREPRINDDEGTRSYSCIRCRSDVACGAPSSRVVSHSHKHPHTPTSTPVTQHDGSASSCITMADRQLRKSCIAALGDRCARGVGIYYMCACICAGHDHLHSLASTWGLHVRCWSRIAILAQPSFISNVGSD